MSMSQSAPAPAACNAACSAASTASRGSGRPGRSSTARSPDEAGVQFTPNWRAMAASWGASTTIRSPGAGPGPSTTPPRGPASSNRSESRTVAACSVVIGRSVAADAAEAAGRTAERHSSTDGIR
jgi:hypothetical protein